MIGVAPAWQLQNYRSAGLCVSDLIMKKMYRIALIAILGTAAFAQTDAPPTEKPPAELEQAVLARAGEG